ncbi:MAG: type II toxin-antitoxin system VapC family toxin [Thermaerobacter sp.]|nr:type II toxin-antitoxin system VapC family toxin [Thermaerobacter sp.]
MRDGYVDTNVFLHAHAHDDHTTVCQALLRATAAGRVTVWLDPMVLRELTYVLPRYVKSMTRADVVLYVRTVLNWPGIQMDDKPLWLGVLETWETDARLSWTDAVLIQRALGTGRCVWSRNHRDFTRYALPEVAWPE